MSVPLGEAELRQQLLSRDEEFRKLAAEHQSYDEQLEQLSRRHHLSADERMQEITLKKKKLMLKDQMYSMLQQIRKQRESESK